MGKIKNSHHAKDDIESGGDEKKNHAVGEPMYSLGYIH
jgi:hypothetical protein